MSFRAIFRPSHITRRYASVAKSSPRKGPPKPKSTPNPKPPPPHTSPTAPRPTTIQTNEHQTLALPDSRTLGFSTYGPSNVPVLLYFHGFPGSRLDARSVVCDDNQTRVIGIDRPGIGLSSFQLDRNLLDWPRDVKFLVDHMGIERFRVVGVSGGGPYAIACAHAFSRQRLRATGVVAGAASPEVSGLLYDRGKGAGRSLLGLGRGRAWARFVLGWKTWWGVGRKLNGLGERARADTVRRMAGEMGYHGPMLDYIESALVEPFRGGVRGYVEDSIVLNRPWGFQLEDVKAKNIMLWYGEKDENTPIEWGRQMADKLDGAVLKSFPDDTHYTLLQNHRDEIIRSLMKAG